MKSNIKLLQEVRLENRNRNSHIRGSEASVTMVMLVIT